MLGDSDEDFNYHPEDLDFNDNDGDNNNNNQNDGKDVKDNVEDNVKEVDDVGRNDSLYNGEDGNKKESDNLSDLLNDSNNDKKDKNNYDEVFEDKDEQIHNNDNENHNNQSDKNSKGNAQSHHNSNLSDLLNDDNNNNNNSNQQQQQQEEFHNEDNNNELPQHDQEEDEEEYGGFEEDAVINNNNNENKQEISNDDVFLTQQKNKKQFIPSFNNQEPTPSKPIETSTSSVRKSQKHPRPLQKKSPYEQATEQYQILKAQIQSLLNSQETTDPSLLQKQNTKMLSLFSQLNSVLALLTESPKIKSQSSSSNRYNTSNIDTSVNNDKILHQYQTEHSKLEKRLKELTNPEYTSKLESDLITIKKNIIDLQKQIKQMQNDQKVYELKIENQLNNPSKSQVRLKRVEMDYQSTKKKYDSVMAAIEKNKQIEKDNQTKITELESFKEKMEQIAKDMYGITEFVCVEKENKKEMQKEKELALLRKNVAILNQAREMNKKKYEKIIRTKEKEIFEKQQIKEELHNKLREEEEKEKEIAMKIAELNPVKQQLLDIQKKKEHDEVDEKELLKEELQNVNEYNKNVSLGDEKDKDTKSNTIEDNKNNNNEESGKHGKNRYPLPPVQQKGVSRKPDFGSIKLNNIVNNNNNIAYNINNNDEIEQPGEKEENVNDNSDDNINNNSNINDNNSNNNNNNHSYNENEDLIVNDDNENFNNTTQNNKTENNFNEIELADETKQQEQNKVPIFLENYENEQHYSEPQSVHSDNELSLTARQREQELKNLFKPQEDNSYNESNNNYSNDENQIHKAEEDKAKEDAFNNLFDSQNINKSDSQEQMLSNKAEDHGFKVVNEFEDLEEFEV